MSAWVKKSQIILSLTNGLAFPRFRGYVMEVVSTVLLGLLTNTLYGYGCRGIKITKDKIKESLSTTIIDEAAVEKIAERTLELNEQNSLMNYNKRKIEEELLSDALLAEIIKSLPSSSVNNQQVKTLNQTHNGVGDNVGRDKFGK